MEIRTRHRGSVGTSCASVIIDLIVSIDGAELTIDVTNSQSKVNEDLITAFRELADEFENQNKRVAKREQELKM